MQTLVIYRGKFCCGNFSTALHLAKLLENRYVPTLVEVSELDSNDFVKNASNGTPHFALGIHLYYSGKAILELRRSFKNNFPFILIVGGTDVNEFYEDIEAKSIMHAAIKESSCVVCFSEQLRLRCLDVFGTTISSRLRVIKPGVDVLYPPSTELSRSLLHDKLPFVHYENYVILVANLRPVKDVLYLTNAFSDFVTKRNISLAMIIAGSVIDDEYSKTVLKEIDQLHNVYYVGSFSKAEAHALINGSLALVNSSTSEGVSVAILEAMLLKTVVIARKIPGNASLITHGENGLLFSNPGEFATQLQTILSDAELRSKLIDHAFAYAEEHHSSAVEKASYLQLCDKVMSLS